MCGMHWAHCRCCLPYQMAAVVSPKPPAEMKKNMGSVDRAVRIVFAVVVGILYYTNMISGTAAIILGILAVVFLLTSLFGSCPLYIPLGLSTTKKEE